METARSVLKHSLKSAKISLPASSAMNFALGLPSYANVTPLRVRSGVLVDKIGEETVVDLLNPDTEAAFDGQCDFATSGHLGAALAQQDAAQRTLWRDKVYRVQAKTVECRAGVGFPACARRHCG